MTILFPYIYHTPMKSLLQKGRMTKAMYKKLQVGHVLGIVNPVSHAFLAEMIDNSILFDKKHSDYGPDNIARIGIEGVLSRAEEKLIRVRHLLKNCKGRSRNKDESVEDSLRDLSNYATIALLLHTKQWPKSKPVKRKCHRI